MTSYPEDRLVRAWLGLTFRVLASVAAHRGTVDAGVHRLRNGLGWLFDYSFPSWIRHR